MTGRKVNTTHNTPSQPPNVVTVKRADTNRQEVFITREQIVQALETEDHIVEIDGRGFEFSESELLQLLRNEDVVMTWRASSERYF